jgi:hypothetical protein
MQSLENLLVQYTKVHTHRINTPHSTRKRTMKSGFLMDPHDPRMFFLWVFLHVCMIVTIKNHASPIKIEISTTLNRFIEKLQS